MIKVKNIIGIAVVTAVVAAAIASCSGKSEGNTSPASVSNPVVSKVETYTIGGYDGQTYTVRFTQTESGEQPIQDHDYDVVMERLNSPDIGICEDPFSPSHTYLLENQEEGKSIMAGLRKDHPPASLKKSTSATTGRLSYFSLFTGKSYLGDRYNSGMNCSVLPLEFENTVSSLYVEGDYTCGIKAYRDANYGGKWYLVLATVDIGRVNGIQQYCGRQDDLGRICLVKNWFGVCIQSFDNNISSVAILNQ